MKRLFIAMVILFSLSVKAQPVANMPYVPFYDNAEVFPFVMATNEYQQYTDRWALWYGYGGDINNQQCGVDGCATLELSGVHKRKGNNSYKITFTKNPIDYTPIFNFAGMSWKQPSQFPIGLRWMSFSMYLPNTFTADNTPMAFLSMFATPNDSLPGYPTPFYMFFLNEDIYISHVNILNGEPAGETYEKVGSIDRGQWVDWQINRNFTKADSGYIRVYKNGNLFWSFNGPNWMTGGSFQPEPDIFLGFNKWTWSDAGGQGWGLPSFNGTYEMWLDEVKFGTMLASLQDMIVGGNAVPGNAPPTVDAGSTQALLLPASAVNVIATGADTDGTIALYKWEQISGPLTGAIQNVNNAATTISGLTAAGSYSFRITVTDNDGSIGTDDVYIIVREASNTNQIPQVTTVNRTIILPKDSVVLQGLAFEEDNFVNSATWTFVSGPITPILTNGTFNNGWPNSIKEAAVTGMTVVGIYRFRYDVLDDFGNYGTDVATVTVFDSSQIGVNQPPVVDAGPNKVIYLPNVTADLIGTILDDQDGIGGLDHAWSYVGGPAGVVITDSTKLNTTVTFPGFGIYNFQLKATDSDGATSADQIQIRVWESTVEELHRIKFKGKN